MKKFLTIVFISAVIGFFTLNVSAHGNNYNQCNANNPENCPIPTVICGNGEHIGNPHCNPTETPEVTNTPTPTLTPTPTITKGCEWDEDCQPTVTPTPTEEPTPTATPEATLTPEPQNNSSSSGISLPGTPQCTVPFDRPMQLVFNGRHGSSVDFSWWPSVDPGVSKQVVYYGLEPGKPLWSQDNLLPTQGKITLNSVPNGSIWVDVQAVKGDCTEDTGWIDP